MIKRPMVLSIAVCAAAVVCLAAAEAPRMINPTQPKDLVLIEIKGTTVDLLPNHIDIITTSPEIEARKLVAAGGKKHEGGFPNNVFFRGILYIFGTPEYWRKATGYRFEDGDVLYIYFVASPEERAEFAAKYKLIKVTDLRRKTGYSGPLYRASPGYYLYVATPVTTFTCAMHPQIATSAEGKCPICAMELVPTESYE